MSPVIERVDRYELAREIGRGTMGVVYLAHDPRLKRDVALKTFRIDQSLESSAAREFQQRFIREAQAAASLTHAHIVTVYDADHDTLRNESFITMEYVPGRSLKEVIADEGPMRFDVATSIVQRLAEALQVAHAASVVHRDIKPANILVRAQDGVAKIADFGVARLPNSDLTGDGISPGSPAYMSPEQFRNRPLDGRSDLFSLAVIYYEMLTGVRPFGGDDIPALAMAVVHQNPVSPRHHVEDLPAGLDRFFERALSKSPDSRIGGGNEWRDALENLGGGAAAGRDSLRAIATAPSGPGRVGVREIETVPLQTPGPGLGEVPGSRARRARPILRWLIAVTILASICLAWGAWQRGKRADVRLAARSRIQQGELTLFVDGQEFYSRALSSAPRHKSRLIRKLVGNEEETFEKWLSMAPGKHELEARLTIDGVESEHAGTIVVDLEPSANYQLELELGRGTKRPVRLEITEVKDR